MRCYAISAGHIQTSETLLLKVREYALPEFNIEKAKHMRSEVSCVYYLVKEDLYHIIL